MALTLIEKRPTILLGLVGEMGSGKSTCARMITDRFPAVERDSFANPVKDVLIRTLQDVARSALESDSYQYWLNYIDTHKHSERVRSGLQFIGDQLGRGIFGNHIWVRYLEQDLHLCEEWVIDDVRYPNEVAMLKSHNFRIVHVYRDPIERENYIMDEARKANPHLSDKELVALVNTWQCHPSEAQIPALDIDETVEYNRFSEWITDTYGTV